jgi:hypothetical protein
MEYCEELFWRTGDASGTGMRPGRVTPHIDPATSRKHESGEEWFLPSPTWAVITAPGRALEALITTRRTEFSILG